LLNGAPAAIRDEQRFRTHPGITRSIKKFRRLLEERNRLTLPNAIEFRCDEMSQEGPDVSSDHWRLEK